MKKLFTFLIVSTFSTVLFSQGHYLIYLKDKDTTINLTRFFDPKSIERRAIQGINFDFLDYPVNYKYVEEIKSLSDTFFYAYRWLNAVWIYTSKINIIESLPYVTKIEKLNEYKSLNFVTASAEKEINQNHSKEEILKSQINSMQGLLFHQKGYKGNGIRIAVFDAGFTKANKSIFLKHLFEKEKILKAHDFIKNDTIKYKFSHHGRMTLACIAGKKDETLIGIATEAEFLLARTEYSLWEVFKEELYWLKAAEWADKNGAYIINSSLGYEKKRYCKSDMNGKSTFVTLAALTAAKKGILVINSAGNSGDKAWRIITAPADADSILTVGGTMCCNPIHIDFSSFGPTYDGRIKPEVVANAEVMSDGITKLSKVYGTSFSAPLISGFAACAWQANKTLTNMQLRQKIIESSSLYPYFDYAHGYGIPQASSFLDNKRIKRKTQIENLIKVYGSDEFIYIAVKNPENKENVVYYKVCDENDNIINYGAGTTLPKKETILYLNRAFVTDKKLIIYFLGNIKTYYF